MVYYYYNNNSLPLLLQKQLLQLPLLYCVNIEIGVETITNIVYHPTNTENNDNDYYYNYRYYC